MLAFSALVLCVLTWLLSGINLYFHSCSWFCCLQLSPSLWYVLMAATKGKLAESSQYRYQSGHSIDIDGWGALHCLFFSLIIATFSVWQSDRSKLVAWGCWCRRAPSSCSIPSCYSVQQLFCTSWVDAWGIREKLWSCTGNAVARRLKIETYKGLKTPLSYPYLFSFI